MADEKLLTCPCCGKDVVRHLEVTDQVKGFLAGTAEKGGDAFGELVLVFFDIMHNPEKGESYDGSRGRTQEPQEPGRSDA